MGSSDGNADGGNHGKHRNGPWKTHSQYNATSDAYNYEKSDEESNKGDVKKNWLQKALEKLEGSWFSKFPRLESEVLGLKNAHENGIEEYKVQNDQKVKKLNEGL